MCFCIRKLYYRKVSYHFDELPDIENPVIIAANHQNALIDCLLTICALQRQPVYLARADIFKNRIIASILYKLKVAPVYRIRDGLSNMAKNSESFELSIKVLLNRGVLALFPEGGHNDKEQLLSLRKGLGRIALQAQQQAGESLNLKIIPLGITYSHYYKPQSRVRLHFGESINVADFIPEYNDNSIQAIKSLNEKLALEIKKRCIDIESRPHYEIIRKLRKSIMFDSLNGNEDIDKGFNISKKFTEDINHIEKSAPDQLQSLLSLASSYYSKLSESGVDEKYYFRSFPGLLKTAGIFILALISLPLYLSGFFLHLLPYGLPYLYTRKGQKGTQFTASIIFPFCGLISFPVFYTLYAVIIFNLTQSILLTASIIVLIMLSGLFTFRYKVFIKDLFNYIKLIRYKANYRKSYVEFRILQSELISTLRKVSEFDIRT